MWSDCVREPPQGICIGRIVVVDRPHKEQVRAFLEWRTGGSRVDWIAEYEDRADAILLKQLLFVLVETVTIASALRVSAISSSSMRVASRAVSFSPESSRRCNSRDANKASASYPNRGMTD